MIELMIETWLNPGVAPAFRWSVWMDSKRVAMGGPHDAAAASEAEALEYCNRRLKREPDRITRL